MADTEIYNLIPPDELFYNEDEQKYNAISDKTIEKLCYISIAEGIEDNETILALVNWANYIRVSYLLLKHALRGDIGIKMDIGKTDPIFYALDEEIEDEQS